MRSSNWEMDLDSLRDYILELESRLEELDSEYDALKDEYDRLQREVQEYRIR